MAASELHHSSVRSAASRPAWVSGVRLQHLRRLDDVRPNLLVARAFAAAVGLKAVERLVGGHWMAGLVLVIAAGVLVWTPRYGAVATAAGLALFPITSHTVMLMLWVAVILAVFPDWQQQRIVLRTQVTALYLFAGSAKLFSSDWLSGAVLTDPTRGTLLIPGWVPLGVLIVAAVVGELGLAVLLWTAPRLAVWAAAALHLGITVGMWTFVPDAQLPLLIFNGLAFVVVYATRPTQVA